MTDLDGAALTRVVLTRAKLNGAVLLGVDLSGANLSQVILRETVFSNTNLTDVRGLETCYHQGPSTLDHRTLAPQRALPVLLLLHQLRK
jgi:uncharacterized protein YjbI with pentapeptide repeats